MAQGLRPGFDPLWIVVVFCTNVWQLLNKIFFHPFRVHSVKLILRALARNDAVEPIFDCRRSVSRHTYLREAIGLAFHQLGMLLVKVLPPARGRPAVVFPILGELDSTVLEHAA